MANLTIERDCTTNAPVSATQQTSISEWSTGAVVYASATAAVPHPAGHTPAAPVSAAATPEIRTATVFAYFGSGVGYRLVHVAIQERPDATVLAMILPCGETARIWAYPHGVGIQVKSKSHAGRWHEVTAARCTCERWHYQHRCTHHDIAASEAMEVYERWQRFSGYEATEGQAA